MLQVTIFYAQINMDGDLLIETAYLVVKTTHLAFGHSPCQLGGNSKVCNLHYHPSELPFISPHATSACIKYVTDPRVNQGLYHVFAEDYRLHPHPIKETKVWYYK